MATVGSSSSSSGELAVPGLRKSVPSTQIDPGHVFVAEDDEVGVAGRRPAREVAGRPAA